MLKVVVAILVVATITMVTNIRTYDSTVLRQIQDQSKLKENHYFFSLEPKTRSKIISLGIWVQLKLYRWSREENAYSIGYILLSTIRANTYTHLVWHWWKQFCITQQRMHHRNAIIHSLCNGLLPISCQQDSNHSSGNCHTQDWFMCFYWNMGLNKMTIQQYYHAALQTTKPSQCLDTKNLQWNWSHLQGQT